MVQEKILTIRTAAWSMAAEQMLEKAMRADPLTGINGLRYLVECGKAQLFEVLDDCYLVAAIVCEVIPKANGFEGQITAAGGKLAGTSLTRQVLPAIERLMQGCKVVSILTARRGLVKELERQGYTCALATMRKAL